MVSASFVARDNLIGGRDRLIVLDTNPLGVRIGNGRIIKIMNANFCILYFYFLLETEPEAPRSETLVAGLGLDSIHDVNLNFRPLTYNANQSVEVRA